MYFLKVKGDFSAALYISGGNEKYRGMHGHDFRVVLTLKSAELDENGMVYNYKIVKDTLSSVTDSLDHILLNDKSEFIEKNPTVENLAGYIYDEVMSKLQDLPLYEVEVSQLTGFSAYFRPQV